MKCPLTFWGLVSLSPLPAAIVTWDNEATLNGEPNTSFFADKNWDSNSVPGSGDQVRILTHGDIEPVVLSTNSATVLSITCKVPFDLGSTITVLSASEFENSLVGQRIGTIRADGLVTFKGSNNGIRTTLEGATGFQNDGALMLAGRPVSATFLNSANGEVTLTSNGIALSNFANAGMLQLGPSGDITSSSSVLNTGTIRKDDPTNTSEIAGDLEQVSGAIEVGAGAELSISGRVQQFKGGSVTANGLLRLTSSVGGTPERSFAGLAEISGSGFVDQVRSYDVEEDLSLNLSTAPGYEAGDLSIASGKTLTNLGNLRFSGSETFGTATGNPLSASFVNSGSMTSSGNPLFDVYTQNPGTFSATSFRIGTEFENSGTLELSGSFTRLSPFNGGFLINNGTVDYNPELAADAYEIAAEVRNEPGGTLKASQGRLTLSQPSTTFAGTVSAVASGSLVRLWGSQYDANGGELSFTGNGEVEAGASGLQVEIVSDNFLLFAVGDPVSDPVASTGFWLYNGLITSPSADLANSGIFHWRTGSITAPYTPGPSSSGFINNGKLILENSGQRKLVGNLIQKMNLEQKAALASDPASFIRNSGSWEMQGPSTLSNSNLASTDPADMLNEGSLNHSYTGTSIVHLDFRNPGSVHVASGTLDFRRPSDLDVNGVLSGQGSWSVQSGAAITFPRTLVHLTDGVSWSGGSSTSVSLVDGGASFAPDDGQTNPALTVTGGGTLLVGGTFNCPDLNLDGGTLASVGGTINGNITGLDNAVIQGVQNSTVTGSMQYSSSTRQTFDLADPVPSQPTFNVDGNVTVGGTLVPTFSTAPSLGSSYPVVSSASSLGGEYDFIDHSQTGGRLKFNPSYTATTVSITPELTTYASYEDWSIDNFSAADRLDPSISGKDADPDEDRLTNFQEYCHATPPCCPTINPCSIADRTETHFTIEFPWAEGMADAGYSVETGDGLTSFTPVAGAQTTTSGNDSVKNCRIEIPTSEFSSSFYVVVRSVEVE
ncbi:hypothetical protein [Luteolibacter marinus]|uniref:hypothetical protein n=1 Tax=Luteolibacter marinus TaxID=2776705 RepID=UPI0018679362|nr:hypothetical protein [Luteolibacter marinus]